MGIVKQGNIYHFRLFIPLQFQDDFCNKTLKFTLKTTHLREAQKKAKIIKSLTDTFFNKLQKGHSMDRHSLNNFIREYVRDGLEQFDEEQAHGRRGNPNTVDQDLLAYGSILADSKEALSERRHIELTSHRVLRLRPDVEAGSEAHERLCYEALKAEICRTRSLPK